MQQNVIINEGKAKEFLKDNCQEQISVCAYCRVSTDLSDQRNSFEAQKRFFQNEFEKHKNWTSKVIFADEGISGTSLDKRDEFNRMIGEALAGKYKLIITKEVSRFSRNIQDILNIVVNLREKGVFVWFLTEDIYTENTDYREQLTNLGVQAESESRKTSKRVRWGQRERMKMGVVFGRREMYGYNIVKDGTGKQYFEIIEDEAEIVRRVFTMYSEGIGTYRIAKQLENEGIKTKRYKNGWSNTVILRMLRNEKYVGDLRQGKTYTPDCLTHKKKYNHGESFDVYIPNHHPESAIIDRELWSKVQKLVIENSPDEERKRKHTNRYWCSGKVYCGECGKHYVSRKKTLKNGEKYSAWKCIENIQYGAKKTRISPTGESIIVGCTCESVNEKVLQEAMYDVLTNIMQTEFKEIYTKIKFSIDKNPKKDATFIEREIKKLETKQQKINERLDVLTERYLDGKLPEYLFQSTLQKNEEELQNINELIAIKSKMFEESSSDVFDERLAEIKKLITLKDKGFSTDIYRSILKKIEVLNGHILKIYIMDLEIPITLKYKTVGRRENFKAEFQII